MRGPDGRGGSEPCESSWSFGFPASPCLCGELLLGERRRAASKSKGDACASPLVGHCKVISFSSRPSWSPSLQPFSSLAFLFSLFHSHGSCDIVSSQFVLCIESAQRIVKQKTSADVCIWATLDGFSNASCRALRMLVARNRNSIQGGQLCECVQPA